MKTTSATRFPGARNLFRFIARFFEARRMAPNFAENDRLKMPHAEAGMWNARPHPGPLPRGEGESFSVSWNVVSQCPPDALSQKLDRATATPSPGGEGRGEGERQTILAFELFALRMRRLAQIPALLLLLTLPAVVQAHTYATQKPRSPSRDTTAPAVRRPSQTRSTACRSPASGTMRSMNAST